MPKWTCRAAGAGAAYLGELGTVDDILQALGVQGADTGKQNVSRLRKYAKVVGILIDNLDTLQWTPTPKTGEPQAVTLFNGLFSLRPALLYSY